MNRLHIWWRELFGALLGTVVEDTGEAPGSALYRMWVGLGYPAALVELVFTQLAVRIDELHERLEDVHKDVDYWRQKHAERREAEVRGSLDEMSKTAEARREADRLRQTQVVLVYFARFGYPANFWPLMYENKRIQAIKCLREASQYPSGEARFGLLPTKLAVDALGENLEVQPGMTSGEALARLEWMAHTPGVYIHPDLRSWLEKKLGYTLPNL